ncbi:nuclear transport factor 2 family protein [Nonomuraea sp. NPDC050790]|uniref:nuclear transport factor 2 family protein n=1 Tax=Nonomuraea sp. NPDC050790 TaxID=3364371 RepID=UPI0037BAAB46
MILSTNRLTKVARSTSNAMRTLGLFPSRGRRSPGRIVPRSLWPYCQTTERIHAAAAFGLLADDVVFHIGGDCIVTGEHRGKDAIVRLGTLVREETGGTFHTRLLSVQANDSYAVTLHHGTAERRGERIEMDNFIVYGFARGLVKDRWGVRIRPERPRRLLEAMTPAFHDDPKPCQSDVSPV